MDWSTLVGLGGVPVIVALVALGTLIGVPKPLAPLTCVVLGILWNLALAPLVTGGVYPLILQGVLAGLSAAGLYDLGKAGVRAALSHNETDPGTPATNLRR